MTNKHKTKAPPSSGVYLFSGEDDFRKKLSLEKLKAKLLAGGSSILDYELYYGKTSRAEEIINSLETASFTGNKRLIVLKEPELLPEEEKEKLTSYIQRCSKSSSVLVLLSKALPAGKGGLSDAILKHGNIIDFPSLKPDEVSEWIIKEFKAKGKLIGRRQAEIIRLISQGDLGQASSAIEQISLFTGNREKITDDDISRFSEVPSESSIFKLLDSINEKDRRASLQILEAMIGAGSSPFEIIGLLGWHIARLITLKKLLIRKISKPEIISCLNLKGFILDKLISQAGNFNIRQLKDKLDLLIDTDLMLKRSSIKSRFLLEMLVVKLTT
jgi:DNA polymerase-3 subunit delta